MSGTELFEKARAAGFNSWLWSPPHTAKFTPEDWKEILIFTHKVQELFYDARLPGRRGELTYDPDKLYLSLGEDFWQAVAKRTGNRDGKVPARKDLCWQALVNVGVPLGISMSGRGGAETVKECYKYLFTETARKWPAEEKDNLVAGLRQAILSYDGGNYPREIFISLMEIADDWFDNRAKYGIDGNALPSVADLVRLEKSLRLDPARDGDDDVLRHIAYAVSARTSLPDFNGFVGDLKKRKRWRPDFLGWILGGYLNRRPDSWFNLLQNFAVDLPHIKPPRGDTDWFRVSVFAHLLDVLDYKRTTYRDLIVDKILQADPVANKVLLDWLFDPRHEYFLKWERKDGKTSLQLVAPGRKNMKKPEVHYAEPVPTPPQGPARQKFQNLLRFGVAGA